MFDIGCVRRVVTFLFLRCLSVFLVAIYCIVHWQELIKPERTGTPEI